MTVPGGDYRIVEAIGFPFVSRVLKLTISDIRVIVFIAGGNLG